VRAVVVAIALATVVASEARSEEKETLRVVSVFAGGFDLRPNEKASLTALGLARDYAVVPGSRFALTGELYPVVLVRQSTEDRLGTELRPALAAAWLFTYRGGARDRGVGFRVEAGSGFSWAWYGSIPTDGTRFNFYNQLGASIVWKRGPELSLALGYRFIHLSNLSLFPDNANPGVSFHSAVVAIEWPR